MSYFAALLSHQAIVDKGCGTIDHRMKDAYYKCLLWLPADRLVAMIANMGGETNDWFAAQLVDVIPEVSVDEHDAIEDQEAAPHIPEVYGDLGVIAPPVVSQQLSRCTVDVGDGTFALKVFFDNCTHASGEQRGWVLCSHHDDCRRYRYVAGRSRLEFCADMYAWHSINPVLPSKLKHLEAVPDPAAVDLVSLSCRVQDF